MRKKKEKRKSYFLHFERLGENAFKWKGVEACIFFLLFVNPDYCVHFTVSVITIQSPFLNKYDP